MSARMIAFAAVLFDVDDTLYDRRGAQRIVLRQMAARLPELFSLLSEDTLLAAFDQSDRETGDHRFSLPTIRETRTVRWQKFLELLNLQPDRAEELTDLYVNAYRQVKAPISEAVSVVKTCSRRYRIGVVSNAFPDVQYHKLEAIGLRSLFQCIVLSEEAGIRKPEAAIFLQACKQLQVSPDETLYVGDSFANDVVGAHAAGLASCWFNPEGLAPPPGATEPNYVIASLPELLLLLDGSQPLYE